MQFSFQNFLLFFLIFFFLTFFLSFSFFLSFLPLSLSLSFIHSYCLLSFLLYSLSPSLSLSLSPSLSLSLSPSLSPSLLPSLPSLVPPFLTFNNLRFMLLQNQRTSLYLLKRRGWLNITFHDRTTNQPVPLRKRIHQLSGGQHRLDFLFLLLSWSQPENTTEGFLEWGPLWRH